jgi:hypothetical protein
MIVIAVRWSLRYGLSDRDVEELLAEQVLPPSFRPPSTMTRSSLRNNLGSPMYSALPGASTACGVPEVGQLC